MDPIDPTSTADADATGLRPAGAAPPDIDALLERAHLLIERRRWREAEAVLRQGLAVEPSHPDLLTELARTLYAQDESGEARLLLSDVLAKEPTHLQARYLMFNVLLDLGEQTEAEPVILGLIRDYPGSPDFLSAYARLMLRALQIDKARGLVAEALRLAPDDHGTLRTAALCDLVDGRRGDTEAMRRLLAEDPGSRETLSLVISALVERGRLREARRLAKELLRAQPDDPYALARVQSLAGDTHWALLPLWPLQRWGWTGSIAIWLGAVAFGRWLERAAPEWAEPFWICWLTYAIYSWVAPPVVRWLARR